MKPLTDQETEEAAVAIKARMVSMTVLELLSTDLEALDRQLQEATAQASSFFRNAPVLLDFQYLDAEPDPRWLERASHMVRAHHFVPVGMASAPESLVKGARETCLAVWPGSHNGRQESAPEPEPEPVPPARPKSEPEPEPEPEVNQEKLPAQTMTIHQPVRSGQKVYARGGDLLVLASVSTGAEIMADGHIHVYGTLRGRALAGALGDENARIFCQDLQADLVSIAGLYTINEDLPQDKCKTAVQIFLDQDQLHIESL
ncbi:septum site-determining protein MinC [Desulfogranum mediterraneum]|uniref:septum site-determining protein MinC n=1 Tax=Desulfogranum mediterraneum TaxID=160661 RepID=UPI0003FA7D28|nr:septum site-determining protein MinC [Desulfogranum mediterraneum]